MKVIHEYNGILFDSREEIWMAMYLDELKQAGYVIRWKRVTEPRPIFEDSNFKYTKTTVLKTKTKVEEKEFTLLRGMSYTPDFKVQWAKKGLGKFYSCIKDGHINPKSWFFLSDWDSNSGYIEVKPNFDQNSKTAKFSIIQKILWKTQGLFIDLCQPEKLFEGTFMPVAAMDDFKYKKSPTGKNKGKKGPGDWKTDYTPLTLKEFLKQK
jgi:hypothetical protein